MYSLFPFVYLCGSDEYCCYQMGQYVGVDPLQAGNAVQLILVLGLTLGWISTYIFRVGNKEMTYAQQLRDYESQVMQVRDLSLGLLSSSVYVLYTLNIWLVW